MPNSCDLAVLAGKFLFYILIFFFSVFDWCIELAHILKFYVCNNQIKKVMGGKLKKLYERLKKKRNNEIKNSIEAKFTGREL